jgi:ELWxxDGT repeat protein
MKRGSITRLMRPLVLAAVIPALIGLTPPQTAVASSGPTVVKNINLSGDSDPSYLTKVGTTLFFAANDGIHGRELWKSDGTAAGTKMVKDVRAGSRGSFPGDLINVSGTLFFTANDGSHGRELWKSDGSAAGTKLVKDLTNDEFSGTNTHLYLPVAVGGQLFFFVSQCCAGFSSLYVSDGTAAGTRLMETPVEEVTSARALNGKLYFVELSYGGDQPQMELWVSNGTTPGTHVVAGAPTGVEMQILPTADRYLYFAVRRIISGQERIRLWRTDGTSANTIALTTAGQLTIMPEESGYLNHAIYFSSNGLWRTNGTAAGTTLISGGALRDLTSAAGRIFFIRGSQPEVADDHLWVSDGTRAGTRDVGQFGMDPGGLVGVGGYLCFFAGYTTNSPQLWQSNGTSAGTHLVKTWPVGDTGLPAVAINSRLYFAANDGTRGNELWKYTP